MTQRTNQSDARKAPFATPSNALLVLPLKFATHIKPYSAVLNIGKWLVCLPSPEESLGHELEIFTTAKGQRDWLESCFTMQKERTPQVAQRFLLKYGTFRPQLPMVYRTAFSISQITRTYHPLISVEERKTFKRELSGKSGLISCISEADFWTELELLENIVEIAGNVARQMNFILIKDKVERAHNLLNDLQFNAAAFGAPFGFPPKRFQAERTAERAVQQVKGFRRGKLSLPDQVRASLRRLLERAFGHAFGPLFFNIFESHAGNAIGLRVEGRTILGCSYFCLLANYSQNWKRCERPDCRNLYLASGRRRKYCDWYCGHIESVRRSRNAGAKN